MLKFKFVECYLLVIFFKLFFIKNVLGLRYVMKKVIMILIKKRVLMILLIFKRILCGFCINLNLNGDIYVE